MSVKMVMGSMNDPKFAGEAQIHRNVIHLAHWAKDKGIRVDTFFNGLLVGAATIAENQQCRVQLAEMLEAWAVVLKSDTPIVVEAEGTA